jgi:hypothetical protein
MSAIFLVYDEDEDRPSLITSDLAEALELFCKAVREQESARLVWSS